MRKITTILCSIAFMVSGIMMAITASDQSPGTSYKTIAAATVPQIYGSSIPMELSKDTGMLDIPEEFVRNLAKQKGVLDTVYITKTDTIKEQVTKVKWRRNPVPTTVVMRDTIREAHYYLATQVDKKEGSTGECISVYEVHEIDKICPENNNSSIKLMNELDGDVGE